MICLGFDEASKREAIRRYVDDQRIEKVVVFSPKRFQLQPEVDVAHEHVEWAEIIKYRFYYRLLKEVGHSTLLVMNECLRTQDRNDLTYNCLRNYLNQTTHQLVFQRFPLIDTIDDFAILFDLDTKSRWKRVPFEKLPLGESRVAAHPRAVHLRALPVPIDEKTRTAYQREKRRLIDGIGLSDPHTIPRNLLLFAGRAKLSAVAPEQRYVGRNNRFKLPNLETFEDVAIPGDRVVFEPCHRFIDFADYLSASDQEEVPLLVTELKVDGWYFQRFTDWSLRISDAYAALQR